MKIPAIDINNDDYNMFLKAIREEKSTMVRTKRENKI